MDKKDAAWELFKEGWTQTKIAKILGVSERTIGNWKNEGDWDSKMIRHKQLWENNEAEVATLISYQLRTLRRLTKEWEEEGKNRLIGKGEVDSLSKLYSTIKKKDITWGYYINVCKDLMQFLQREDIELAQALTEQLDIFLNEKRQQL